MTPYAEVIAPAGADISAAIMLGTGALIQSKLSDEGSQAMLVDRWLDAGVESDEADLVGNGLHTVAAVKLRSHERL